MTATTAIVFGSTGNVGSVAARAARKQGLKIVLAMRDTKKSIPDLSAEQEHEGGYERVEADLTKPDTIKAAVQKFGAKRAFIYLVHGSPDHMRSAIVALKAAGIEFVVFLSSFTIYFADGLESVPPSHPISFIHAQVELALEEIFGSNGFVAPRPAAFATNTLRWKTGYASGDVKIVAPEAKFDFISAIDIGEVSGVLLARGAEDPDRPSGQTAVLLCGPQLISQEDAAKVIAKAVGKNITVSDISDEEALAIYTSLGIATPIANYLIRITREAATEEADFYSQSGYNGGVENIRKYTGREPIKFQEWAEQNKHLFT